MYGSSPGGFDPLASLVFVNNVQGMEDNGREDIINDRPISQSPEEELAQEALHQEEGFEHLDGARNQKQSSNGHQYKNGVGRRPLMQFRNPFLSYCQQFQDIFVFGQNASEQRLRSLCQSGRLKPIYFRHFTWSIFLDLFPPNVADWIGLVRSRREQYLMFKSALMNDERGSSDMEPDVNNPLSQDSKSPWNKYFLDNKLREEIRRDVVRTKSSHALFERSYVYEMMVTILFLYAKKYPNMNYHQGMHEILAVILIVLSDCQKEYLKCANFRPEDSVTKFGLVVLNSIRVLNDPEHMEADSFFMFEKFMEKMWDWYFIGDEWLQSSSRWRDRPQFKDKIPFQESDELFVCPGGQRLRNLWENVLQTHDPELYHYLQAMAILPTTFCINWTKLLFSRQFPSEFLIIWDAILSSNFTIVDFIVVSMIISIRTLLLAGDPIKCTLMLVTQYPTSVDIKYVIAKAFHIKEPLNFTQPSRSPFKFSLPYLQEMSSSSSSLSSSSRSRSSKERILDGEIKDSKAVKSKKKFGIKLDPTISTGQAFQDERKMVPLSDRLTSVSVAGDTDVGGAEDENFVFLEREPSQTFSPVGQPSVELLSQHMLVWQAKLRESLKGLKKALHDEDNNFLSESVQRDLDRIEGVSSSMAQLLRHSTDLGVDAITLEEDQDGPTSDNKC